MRQGIDIAVKVFQNPHKGSLRAFLFLPSSLVAIFGLAFISVGREAFRYPVVDLVMRAGGLTIDVGNILSLQADIAATLIGLLVLAFLCSKQRCMAVFGSVCVVLASVVMAIGYLGRFNSGALASNSAVLGVCSELVQFLGYYLVVAWAKILYDNEGDRSVALLAASFLVAGIFQALLGVFQPLFATLACSFAPPASILLMLLYRSLVISEKSAPEFPTMPYMPDAACKDEGKTAFAAAQVPKKAADFQREFAFAPLCFFCYGILAYSLFSEWLSAQNIEFGAQLIQILGAFGSVSAGVVLLVMLLRDGGNAEGLFFKLLVFVVMVIAVFIATFLQNDIAAFLFISLLDLSHKLVLFVVWYLPFATHRIISYESRLSLLLFFYQLGSFAAMIFLDMWTNMFVILLFSLVFLSFDLVVQFARRIAPSDATGEATTLETKADEQPPRQVEAYQQILFTVYLSDTFQLTKREFEVASLLAQGKNVRDIACALTVSTETAKSHKRNVFAKMEVSSQQELIDKIAAIRKGDFLKFLDQI